MTGPRYHLAWFKLNADFFMSGQPTSEVLQYALVPEELPERGAWSLDRVDLNGRPMPTQRTPRWSKMVLPDQVVAELRRLGGAGL